MPVGHLFTELKRLSLYSKLNQASSDEYVLRRGSTVNLTGKVQNIKLWQEANTDNGFVQKIIWYMEI